MTITQYPWKSEAWWHFPSFCALLLWVHITVEDFNSKRQCLPTFCIEAHGDAFRVFFCCVRFWNVLVIFTGPKSTPVPFSVIFHPLSIIFCCKFLCWWLYLALQQTDVYPWWLFTNEKPTLTPDLNVCLFTECSVWTTWQQRSCL